MKKQSFAFHRAFKDALKEYPDSVRLQVYEAIIDYGLDLVKPKLTDKVADALFKCAQTLYLDSDIEKWQKRTNKRKSK